MLLKALLNLPATDFTIMLYILPEKLQTDVSALSDVYVLKMMDAAVRLTDLIADWVSCSSKPAPTPLHRSD